MLNQHRHYARGNRDDAITGIAFRFDHTQLARPIRQVDSLHSLTNRNCSLVEVSVLPEQSQRFTEPEASDGHQDEERPKAMRFRRSDERLNLVGTENSRLCFLPSWWFSELHHVAGHEQPLLRLGER